MREQLAKIFHRRSDGPSGLVHRNAEAADSAAPAGVGRRPDEEPATSMAWQPLVPDHRSWQDVGGVRRADAEPLQLLDSRAAPGGAPVKVDPAMVNAATAERMRPLIRP